MSRSYDPKRRQEAIGSLRILQYKWIGWTSYHPIRERTKSRPKTKIVPATSGEDYPGTKYKL